MSDVGIIYEKRTEKFETSSYYMKHLPDWDEDFKDRELADYFLTKKWEPLFPIETYHQSTEDDKDYEGTMIGKKSPTFPYDFSTTDKDYGSDRKSTRMNSSHVAISYAVFCFSDKYSSRS